MKLLSAKQIKEWDVFTIRNKPISSIDLMEHAATRCFDEIKKLADNKTVPNNFIVFCGPGNNGGDGLVIARLLAKHNYRITVYVLLSDITSTEFTENLKRVSNKYVKVVFIGLNTTIPKPTEPFTAIDALFGIGLNKSLDGAAANMVSYINNYAQKVIAIDIPSGLPAEINDSTNLNALIIVEADVTLTFQQPKLSFLFADTYKYVGDFKILDIDLHSEYLNAAETDIFYIDAKLVQEMLKPRLKYSHKGDYGHALLAGGSYGKIGAMVLSTKAALASGCGLATALIPKVGYTILQTALPEAMVVTDDELYELRNFTQLVNYNAVGVGMGMGTDNNTKIGFNNWLTHINCPILIDADGINLCAQLIKEQPMLFKFPANCILTPHPKEFDRLAGHSQNSLERFEKQKQFSTKHQITIVLKTAHTSITCSNGESYFNSSGNPLLATAGSGDVLSGIITSYLAQGYTPEEAAICGVYLHGLCANNAMDAGKANMLASDIIYQLPEITRKLMQP